jgi:hypothetical protein
VTWPPSRPDAPVVRERPWDPGHSAEPSLSDEHERLVYVVVDEIVEGWVGLSFAPWPHADDQGRLRFVDAGDPVEVGTSRPALESFLATESAGHDASGRGRRPDSARDTEGVEVRIGMTFAARVKKGRTARVLDELRQHAAHGEVRVEDLGTILTRPVDLTDEGRLLAKLASYGAMLSTLPADVGERWRLGDELEE